jgi:hypothetical protein
MTKGRHWKRKNVKWTEEIQEWLKERCPAREHGYTKRREVLDELNAVFGTDFSENAFVTHCYESGIQLGLAASNSNIPRGEKCWRHRPVGSFQEKKNYVRIKVAEPNVWMQYQRYVWEQNHPGESSEGMTIIFMDGNNRNFEPSNLERVTRGELAVMVKLGHTADMSREEREICLLRARLAIQKGKLVGREEAARLHRKAYYESVKDSPGFKESSQERARKRYRERMADPVLHEELLEKQREYRNKNRARINAKAREYHKKKRDAASKGQGGKGN